MINRARVALVVAGGLNAAERSAMATTRDLAELIAAAADANLSLPLSMCVGLRPIATAQEAMAASISSQQLLRKAHAEFEAVGRRLGLTEEMWGGSAPKDNPMGATGAARIPVEASAA